MTNTCDLEAWIKKRRLTRQQLAGLIGISPMSLYRKIHNRSEFRAGRLRRSPGFSSSPEKTGITCFLMHLVI